MSLPATSTASPACSSPPTVADAPFPSLLAGLAVGFAGHVQRAGLACGAGFAHPWGEADLLGAVVGTAGHRVSLQDTGTPQVSFTRRVDEAGPAGQLFKLFVPCEVYGQAGEQAGELSAGEAVLVAGKLKWTSWTDKHGQKRTSLCVLARLVKRLAPAAVEVAG